MFLKAALQLPAMETSSLLGDVIGAVGDRVKVYRAERRVMILHDAHERLAARGLTLDQTKPMLEGQVYDLIDGMGSAHTPELADMWAGLMANAMDPNSPIAADQNYARIIQSLSTNDARLLTFVAAVEEQMAWENAQHAKLMEHYEHGADGKVAEKFKRLQKEMHAKIKPKATELVLLYEKLDLVGIQMDEFAPRNLFNLNLIEPIKHSRIERIDLPYVHGDTEAIESAVRQLTQQFDILNEETSNQGFGNNNICSILHGRVTLFGRLSKFGKHFVRACGIWEYKIV